MIQDLLDRAVRSVRLALASERDRVVVRIDTSSRGWRGLSRGKRASDFDPVQLRVGTKVESEHVKSKAMAQRIAMDHLVEDPGYYRKLTKLHLASSRRTPEETKRIGRPPRFWMERCIQSVKAKRPTTRRDPRSLCGWVWYHHMSESHRKMVLEEEARRELLAKKKRRKGKSKSKTNLALYRALLGL